LVSFAIQGVFFFKNSESPLTVSWLKEIRGKSVLITWFGQWFLLFGFLTIKL